VLFQKSTKRPSLNPTGAGFPQQDSQDVLNYTLTLDMLGIATAFKET
jgi:hypothetical protein